MLCVTNVGTSKPDLLRNYICKVATEEHHDCEIWEAASATAAAPIYFRPVPLKSSGRQWSDGGTRRNNPIFEVLAESSRIPDWSGQNIGCIVSIGTGITSLSEMPTKLPAFLKKAVDIMTDSEQIAVDFARSPDGRRLTQQKRYFRFNVPYGLQEIELDDYKETRKVHDVTSFYLSQADNGDRIHGCAKALLNPDADRQ